MFSVLSGRTIELEPVRAETGALLVMQRCLVCGEAIRTTVHQALKLSIEESERPERYQSEPYEAYRLRLKEAAHDVAFENVGRAIRVAYEGHRCAMPQLIPYQYSDEDLYELEQVYDRAVSELADRLEKIRAERMRRGP